MTIVFVFCCQCGGNRGRRDVIYELKDQRILSCHSGSNVFEEKQIFPEERCQGFVCPLVFSRLNFCTMVRHKRQNITTQVKDEGAPASKRPKTTAKKQEATAADAFTSFEIEQSLKAIPCIRSHDASTTPALIFTHGAGGGVSAPAVMNFAHGFAAISPIVCFQGVMNLPSRMKMFHAVVADQFGGVKEVALGGRSMGSRAAVLAAQGSDMIKVHALVLVSYPLKGGKGDVRDQILLDLNDDVDVLFISGDNDSMCDLAELTAVRQRMKAKTWMVTVESADHGMNLRPKRATEQIVKMTGRIAADWLIQRDETKTEYLLAWDDGVGGPADGDWKAGSSVARSSGKEKTDRDITSAEGVGSAAGGKRPRRRTGTHT